MDRELVEEVVFKTALNTPEIVRGILSDIDLEFEEQVRNIQDAKAQILACMPKELRSMKVRDFEEAGWNIEAALHQLTGLALENPVKQSTAARSRTPIQVHSAHSHLSSSNIKLKHEGPLSSKHGESASKKGSKRWKP